MLCDQLLKFYLADQLLFFFALYIFYLPFFFLLLVPNLQ